MALGILDTRPHPATRQRPVPSPYAFKKSMRGLGAVGLGATVPANCWAVPGFDDCNAQGWNQAETKCRQSGQPTDYANQNFGGDVDACKQAEADDYAYYGCAMRLCPPAPATHPLSSGGWTWMNTTPNASVLAFQQHLNTALQADGYKPITADGRLGPATCGAFNFVGAAHADLFASDPVANIGVCQSFTNPTKVGSSTPVPSPTSAAAQALDAQYGGLPWLTADSRVAALQQQINIQLDSNGFLPITVTGMLDPATCGAMTWLDQNTGTRWLDTWGPRGGGSCPSVIMPTPKPNAPAPDGPAPAPSPSDGGTSAGGISTLGIGLLAAVAVGGFAYWKHKTGGLF